MAMITLFRSKPISDTAQIETALNSGLLTMLVGSLLIMVMISVFYAGVDLVSLMFLTLNTFSFWLFSLVFVLPATALLWPIAKRALRSGFAGIGVHGCCGAVTGGFVGLVLWFIFAHNNFNPAGAVLPFSGIGALYGFLFWFGVWRANRVISREL